MLWNDSNMDGMFLQDAYEKKAVNLMAAFLIIVMSKHCDPDVFSTVLSNG